MKLSSTLSEAASDLQWEFQKVNKESYATAMLAQITCQINGKKNSTPPPIETFLPYPQVSAKLFDVEPHIINAILLTLEKLSPSLRTIINDNVLKSRIANTYYWQNNGFIYGEL